MALSAPGSGKTIAVTSSSDGSTMYTVPDGKTFTGHLWNNSSNGPGKINGVQLYWPYSSSYFAHSPLPVTLGGGTQVQAGGGGTTMLVGLET